MKNNNSHQTNLMSSDSEDAIHLAKWLIEFPTALRKLKTDDTSYFIRKTKLTQSKGEKNV